MWVKLICKLVIQVYTFIWVHMYPDDRFILNFKSLVLAFIFYFNVWFCVCFIFRVVFICVLSLNLVKWLWCLKGSQVSCGFLFLSRSWRVIVNHITALWKQQLSIPTAHQTKGVVIIIEGVWLEACFYISAGLVHVSCPTKTTLRPPGQLPVLVNEWPPLTFRDLPQWIKQWLTDRWEIKGKKQ